MGWSRLGENGGFLQTVPLLHTQAQPGASIGVRIGRSTRVLTQFEDIYVNTVRPMDRVSIADAPMVFVGYGVTAPERDWDDFKGVDLHGKIAVFLVNDPDFEAEPGEPVAGKFGGKAMTYYGRWTYKYEEAGRRGALGALIVHETPGAGYGWVTVVAPRGENFDVIRFKRRRGALASARMDSARGGGGFVQGCGIGFRRAEGRRSNGVVPPGGDFRRAFQRRFPCRS